MIDEKLINEFTSVQETYFEKHKKEDWTREDLVKASQEIKKLEDPYLRQMDEECFMYMSKNLPMVVECKIALKKRWEALRKADCVEEDLKKSTQVLNKRK